MGPKRSTHLYKTWKDEEKESSGDFPTTYVEGKALVYLWRAELFCRLSLQQQRDFNASTQPGLSQFFLNSPKFGENDASSCGAK